MWLFTIYDLRIFGYFIIINYPGMSNTLNIIFQNHPNPLPTGRQVLFERGHFIKNLVISSSRRVF
jgi:hypothetical protein